MKGKLAKTANELKQ